MRTIRLMNCGRWLMLAVLAWSAIVAFSCLAHADSVLDRILEQDKITVATNVDYAPQSFQEDDGRWSGFDVDVAREIASRLDVSVEFVSPPWELVLSGKWRGRWDVAINSMAAIKPRDERLNFAVAYYYTPVRAAVFSGDARFEKVDDLQGATIGVCNDCSYLNYVEKRLEIVEGFASASAFELTDVQWRVYPDEWAAVEALGPRDSSEIEAIIAGEPTLAAMLEEDYPIRLLDGNLFNESLAIATEKGEVALAARLKEIVAEMRADGTLKHLSQQWFGADYSRPATLQ